MSVRIDLRIGALERGVVTVGKVTQNTLKWFRILEDGLAGAHQGYIHTGDEVNQRKQIGGYKELVERRTPFLEGTELIVHVWR